MFAPKGTPPAVTAKMTALMKQAFETPTVKEIWGKNGSVIPAMYGSDLGTFLQSELVRRDKVVKDAGVKL